MNAEITRAPARVDGGQPQDTEIEAPGIGVEPNEDALAAHPPKATFMDMNVPGWEMRHAVID